MAAADELAVGLGREARKAMEAPSTGMREMHFRTKKALAGKSLFNAVGMVAFLQNPAIRHRSKTEIGRHQIRCWKRPHQRGM